MAMEMEMEMRMDMRMGRRVVSATQADTGRG